MCSKQAPWDYNFALGAGLGEEGFGGGGFGGDLANINTDSWRFEDGHKSASDWYRILGIDVDFRALVSTRWQALRQDLLSDEALDARISALSDPLTNAAQRDFAKWPVEDIQFTGSVEPTWEGQIQYVREWIMERTAWLDANI